VTFGIPPRSPETGYGYIRRGDSAANSDTATFHVAGFYEKPDEAKAKEYLNSGEYYWNAGIFMLKASVWLQALGRLKPAMLSSCQSSVANGKQDQTFFRLNKEAFAQCPSDSIDYAVLEHLADNSNALEVIPIEMGWSDVGSWPALMELGVEDTEGNVVQGDVITEDTRNSLLISPDRLMATLGVDDLIVVSTPDAVLIAHRDAAQDVRKVVDRLRQMRREEAHAHQKVYRPWGSYEPLGIGERYQVKRLTVKPGAKLSLQMHHHRAEHWVVVRGTAKVTRDDETFLLTENQSTYLPLGTRHRLENPGAVELEVIEVQSGSYLGEDDIVRFEDQYDRVPED
jgi:mannose-1-phosphate guanylyltransferase/mannose-6-phosphate isomerase